MLSDEQNIKRFLNISVSYYFINKIEEYNAIFGQQQIENIHYTISLIENLYKQDKIDNLVKVNIQKCIQWCIKHNISRELTVPSDAPFSREPTVPSDAPSLIDEELVFGISRIDDELVFGDESSRIDEELVFGISRIDEELVFGNEPSLLHEYTIDSRI
jgi:hypothetical protein